MRVFVTVAAGLIVASSALAQQPAITPAPNAGNDTVYVPRYRDPSKRELVAYFIGSNFCGGSQNPEVKAAVRRAIVRLQRHADSVGLSFSVSGVAVDWKPEDGWEYLRSVSAFDEVIVGRNWSNSAAVERLWRSPEGRGLTPQFVLVVRNVHDDGRRLTFTPDEAVTRIEGGDAIKEWVARGAPIQVPASSTR